MGSSLSVAYSCGTCATNIQNKPENIWLKIVLRFLFGTTLLNPDKQQCPNTRSFEDIEWFFVVHAVSGFRQSLNETSAICCTIEMKSRLYAVIYNGVPFRTSRFDPYRRKICWALQWMILPLSQRSVFYGVPWSVGSGIRTVVIHSSSCPWCTTSWIMVHDHDTNIRQLGLSSIRTTANHGGCFGV